MKLMRIQEMEEYILSHGTVSLDELCQVFNVSKNTVRRDINKLTEKGAIEKVYGGVTSIEKTALVPFENRTIQHRMKKQKSPIMLPDLLKITIWSSLIQERRQSLFLIRLIQPKMSPS